MVARKNRRSDNPSIGSPMGSDSGRQNWLWVVAVVGVAVGVGGVIYGLSVRDSSDESNMSAPVATTAAPAATTTTTTTLPEGSRFTEAEKESLHNFCGTLEGLRCHDVVTDLHSGRFAVQCPYSEVKKWIQERRGLHEQASFSINDASFILEACGVCAHGDMQKAMERRWFDSPEWPIILEQNCGT